VLNPEHLCGDISIVNLMGQRSDRHKLTGDLWQHFLIRSGSGFYIININYDTGSISRKVVLK